MSTSEPSPNVILRAAPADHQQSEPNSQAFPVISLSGAGVLGRSVGQARSGRGPRTSEHTQLPQKVHACPLGVGKDRPLAKAISGLQIFLDLAPVFKHNLSVLRGFTFFIFSFTVITISYTISISISFCVVCYTL